MLPKIQRAQGTMYKYYEYCVRQMDTALWCLAWLLGRSFFDDAPKRFGFEC